MRTPSVVRAAVASLAVVLALSSCSDDAQLSTTLDSIGTQFDVAVGQAGFNTTEVRAMGSLASRMDAAFIASGGAALRVSGTRADLLPLLAWGKTFVWDEATVRYITSDRTGAPSNGSRFIIYSVAGAATRPSIPLVERGYVEITRAGNTATVVVVPTGGTEVMRYSLTTGGTASSPTFLVDGSAGSGSTLTTFDLAVVRSMSNGTATQTWQTATPSRGVATLVQRAEGISSTTIGASMRSGVRKMEIAGALGATGAGALAVKVGGALYGRVLLSGSPSNTRTVSNPLGAPLGAAETTAIASTYGWFASSYDMLDMFLRPLHTVLDLDPPA